MQVTWHAAGDYLASVAMPDAGASAVAVHQLSSKRPKGDVQVVDFHRTSPWLFLAVRFAWYEERREIMTADTREHPRV